MKLFLVLIISLPILAYSQTSESSSKLKKAMQKYPQADTNGDGVLTIAEAKSFRDKAENFRGIEPAEAPRGAEKHIYKDVDKISLPLYVYNPEGHKKEDKKPAMVFFFGGGWRKGSPTQFASQCQYLASLGMVAITVEYRVSSRHNVTPFDCVEDAKSAMRWVRGNADKLGVDPDRIGSGGGSAGGHLAACTSLIDDFNAMSDDDNISASPNAMILYNPALAIAPHESLPQEQNLKLARRGKESKIPLKQISPLWHASKSQPPCVIFFGTEDKLLESGQAFQKLSQAAGNSCELITFEGAGHGFFNNSKYQSLTNQEMKKFLVNIDWLKK